MAACQQADGATSHCRCHENRRFTGLSTSFPLIWFDRLTKSGIYLTCTPPSFLRKETIAQPPNAPFDVIPSAARNLRRCAVVMRRFQPQGSSWGMRAFRFLTPLCSVRNDSWSVFSQDGVQSYAKVSVSRNPSPISPLDAREGGHDDGGRSPAVYPPTLSTVASVFYTQRLNLSPLESILKLIPRYRSALTDMEITGAIKTIKTGWPDRQFPSLSHLLQQYALNSASLKVGVTSNYRNRSNYYNAYETRYTEMVLVYKTNSAKNAHAIERKLIDRHLGVLKNERGGGGGRLSQGQPPYYVYIVRSPKSARRNRGSAKQARTAGRATSGGSGPSRARAV